MRQALYQLTLRLELENGTVSDTVAARFGVREIHSEVDPALQGHVFYVNGQRVSSISMPAAVKPSSMRDWLLLDMPRRLVHALHTSQKGLSRLLWFEQYGVCM